MCKQVSHTCDDASALRPSLGSLHSPEHRSNVEHTATHTCRWSDPETYSTIWPVCLSSKETNEEKYFCNITFQTFLMCVTLVFNSLHCKTSNSRKVFDPLLLCNEIECSLFQSSSQRDYIIMATQTPQSQESTPAPKSSVDKEWVTEHARQVGLHPITPLLIISLIVSAFESTVALRLFGENWALLIKRVYTNWLVILPSHKPIQANWFQPLVCEDF